MANTGNERVVSESIEAGTIAPAVVKDGATSVANRGRLAGPKDPPTVASKGIDRLVNASRLLG